MQSLSGTGQNRASEGQALWEGAGTTSNGHQVHNQFLLPGGCMFIKSVLTKDDVESFVYDEVSRKSFVKQS